MAFPMLGMFTLHDNVMQSLKCSYRFRLLLASSQFSGSQTISTHELLYLELIILRNLHMSWPGFENAVLVFERLNTVCLRKEYVNSVKGISISAQTKSALWWILILQACLHPHTPTTQHMVFWRKKTKCYRNKDMRAAVIPIRWQYWS
jgi:hypothetical protein